jgi:DNA-binding response OmpR family regulator
MRIYAIGALEIFDALYDIDRVRMHIFQPRKANVSVDEISRDELYKWAEEVLRPAAEEADRGDGDFHAGEWCRFCKARHICRERARANLALLYLFLTNPGRVYTRENLLSLVWNDDYLGETRTVDVHIGTLRSKLGACAGLIETVRGVGYKLGGKR